MGSSSTAHNILVNGQPTDQIPVNDRGLAYGHGVFETIRVEKGVPVLWDMHLERLFDGCRILKIEQPVDLDQLLLSETKQLCGNQSLVLKILVTAGSGGLGYRLPDKSSPMRIVMTSPLPNYPDAYQTEGVCIRSCQHRLSEQPLLAGLKHLNRLDQVLASAELKATGCLEGIMLDPNGQVVEGTRTNLFGVDHEGKLCTPSLDNCGVAGIMRRYLLQVAKDMGIAVELGKYSEKTFAQMPELFVCNSVNGIWPVKQWEDKRYRPGPITSQLQAKIKLVLQGK